MLDNIIKLQNCEYIHEITKELSLIGNDGGKMGFRCAGSSGEKRTAERIRVEMDRIGLKNITVEEFPVNSWEPLSASLQIDGKTIAACPYAGTTGTEPEGISAQIVDIGKGTASDYEGKCVEGKIVLCTFDMLEDYWVNHPAHQALERGAAAFVCSYEGDAYSVADGSVGCFDGQMIPGFPVVNISRQDGIAVREKLNKEPVEATLKVDVKMDMKGKSSNVIGYIQGRDSSKMIILAGHMDGFFNTYQDDVLAIGINLDIARSILESGYKPEHTIAVVAHGSEEYGISGSRYDWCTGSWFNVNCNHPEWFGKAVAFLNIDAVRPDTPAYNIACTPEWRSFFKSFMKEMIPPPASVWPEGVRITMPKGPWADGFNFAGLGVPELICGGGPSKWSSLNYHTQYDNYTIYEQEKKLIKYVTSNYTEILLAMDKLELPPLDFSHTPENLLITLADIPTEAADDAKALEAASKLLASSGRVLYKKISNANSVECGLNHSDATRLRKQLLKCYRTVHRDLMKLAPNDVVVFPHEPVVNNIKCILGAMEDVKRDNYDEAVNKMFDMDLFKIAYCFDEATYNLAMHSQNCDRDDLYWGTGRLHRFLDARPAANALREKDKEKVLTTLKEMKDTELSMLTDILARETLLIENLNREIQSIVIE